LVHCINDVSSLYLQQNTLIILWT